MCESRERSTRQRHRAPAPPRRTTWTENGREARSAAPSHVRDPAARAADRSRCKRNTPGPPRPGVRNQRKKLDTMCVCIAAVGLLCVSPVPVVISQMSALSSGPNSTPSPTLGSHRTLDCQSAARGKPHWFWRWCCSQVCRSTHLARPSHVPTGVYNWRQGKCHASISTHLFGSVLHWSSRFWSSLVWRSHAGAWTKIINMPRGRRCRRRIASARSVFRWQPLTCRLDNHHQPSHSLVVAPAGPAGSIGSAAVTVAACKRPVAACESSAAAYKSFVAAGRRRVARSACTVAASVCTEAAPWVQRWSTWHMSTDGSTRPA